METDVAKLREIAAHLRRLQHEPKRLEALEMAECLLRDALAAGAFAHPFYLPLKYLAAPDYPRHGFSREYRGAMFGDWVEWLCHNFVHVPSEWKPWFPHFTNNWFDRHIGCPPVYYVRPNLTAFARLVEVAAGHKPAESEADKLQSPGPPDPPAVPKRAR